MFYLIVYFTYYFYLDFMAKKLKKFSKTLYKCKFMWYNIFTVYLESGLSSIITLLYVSGIYF